MCITNVLHNFNHHFKIKYKQRIEPKQDQITVERWLLKVKEGWCAFTVKF